MIYFLYGEDAFRSQEKIREIKNKFLINNPAGSGLSIFDFSGNKKETDFYDIQKAIGARGLFSKKQLLIVKCFIRNAEKNAQKTAVEFFKAGGNILEDKDIVVIFWEEKLPKTKNLLVEYLLKNSKKQKFEMLNEAKLMLWIGERMKNINPAVALSQKAGQKLAGYVGNDLFLLSNELKKIGNFKEKGTIEEEDVDFLVKAKIEANIFATVEALSGGNKKRALELLHNQLENGDDLHYIFSMYVYQFRNLLKIGEYYWQDKRNNYEIAKLTGLHPFVVQKGMAQLRNLSEKDLKKIYKKLEDLDFAVKTGKILIGLALDKFIAEA